MNILFLTTHLNAGGITQYLYTLAKGLKSYNHQVHILSSGGNAEEHFRKIGVALWNRDLRTKSDLSPKIYKSIKPLERYIEDHQIDCLHAQTRVTQVLGRLASRPYGIPYVSTCHGFFKVRITRRIAPCWGDAVIAISQAVKDHLILDFGVDENRIVKIVNGVDLDRFPVIQENDRELARENFGYKDEIVIGQLARLSEVKGQDIAIRAMKRISEDYPHARLLLIGQGKTESHLKELVKDLSLENVVSIQPLINNPREALAAMDVFIMPSRQEGLGISVMEAQASGLPVIASKVGGLPSLIDDGQTGFLVSPESDLQLAEALTRLLSDPAIYADVPKRARDFIVKKHSAERMVKNTLKLYQKLYKRADLE